MAKDDLEHLYDDTTEDFLYKPNIPSPERGFETIGAPRSIRVEAIIEEEIPDVLKGWRVVFDKYESLAKDLKERALRLLDVSTADIDGYIGDAPPYVIQYVTDLTGIEFPEDVTSPVYTLSYETKRCIFRVAGFYANNYDKELLKSASDFDDVAISQYLNNKLSGKSYLGKHGILMYGIKLLVIVLKLSYVIMVYYTIGYLCGFFRGKLKIGKKWKIAGKRFGFEFKLGDMISGLLVRVEETLLSVVGYRCKKRGPNEPPQDCNAKVKSSDDLEKQFSFRYIECCTTKPLFFDNRQFYSNSFSFTSCLQAAINAELDPEGYMEGNICGEGNIDENREPTPEEQAKAKVVADYLIAKAGSKYGVNGYQNFGPLNNAISAADSATLMSQQVKSALTNNSYTFTNFSRGKGPFDCFGYSSDDKTTPEEDIINAINSNAGKWLKSTADPAIVITQAGTSPLEFIGEFMIHLDQAVGNLLGIADRIVSNTANLTLWGSSRQLCCWVYLLVFASTLVRRFVETGGRICNDKMVPCYTCKGTCHIDGHICQTCAGTGQVQDSQAFANNLRHEMKLTWASDIKNSAEVRKFVAILEVMKAIVDTYINSLKRPLLLQGLRLPLHEMWELIKLTISNGLAQFIDVILGPIDVVLSGIQGIPEVRLALANECFGIDKLFDFLICNLNNLKFSLVNSVMRLIDFSINDLVLINDIYLCRTRLATLEALSNLLKSLIDLIIGLKDCYNSSELVDEVLKNQESEQYRQIRDIDDLLNESGVTARSMFEMINPLTDHEFPVSESEKSAIDNLPGAISRSFGPLGGTAEDIVVQSMKNFGTIVKEADLGEKATFNDFIKLLQDRSGVSINEARESMLHIFDILRGSA